MMGAPNVDVEEPHIVSRKQWKAQEPKEAETTKDFPLSYLVLMHTNTPVCKSNKECKKVVRNLQKKHMNEGAPDIHYNYLISVDGTVYEGRSPRMVGIKYNDDNKLTKANNDSINVAYIDNGEERLNGEKLHSAVTKLAAKLIREKIITLDTDIVWFDQHKKKKKQLSISERMDKYKNTKIKDKETNSEIQTEVNVNSERRKKNSLKKIPKDKKDALKHTYKKGPFVLKPHHFGKLIDLKEHLGTEINEPAVFI